MIPTLVAHRVAPRKAWVCQECSGTSQAPTSHPRAKGARTPSTATRNEESPRAGCPGSSIPAPPRTGAPPRRSWRKVDAGIGRDPVESVHAHKVKVAEENPRQGSPRTAGWPRRMARCPISFAASRMTTRYRSSGMEDPPRRERDGGEEEGGGESKNLAEGIFPNMRPLLFIDPVIDPARMRAIPSGGADPPPYNAFLPLPGRFTRRRRPALRCPASGNACGSPSRGRTGGRKPSRR